jgi:hypothetical protein
MLSVLIVSLVILRFFTFFSLCIRILLHLGFRDLLVSHLLLRLFFTRLFSELLGHRETRLDLLLVAEHLVEERLVIIDALAGLFTHKALNALFARLQSCGDQAHSCSVLLGVSNFEIGFLEEKHVLF